MKITVYIEKTQTGFSAYADEELPYLDVAAFTTGSTIDEVKNNIVESMNLYFEEEGKGNKITLEDITFVIV